MISSDDIFQIQSFRNAKVLFDARLLKKFDPLISDPEQLAATNMLTGQSSGRGTSCFFNYQGREWVLRHFRRGGWVARFVEDLYLGRSPEQSRTFLEFNLLTSMLNDGLPVPRPVAAVFWSHGFCHKQDLITQRIPEAVPLAEVLEKQSINSEVWRQIGATISRFHLGSIYHADLNARNILIDKSYAVFLIDFDRGCRRTGRDWQEDNLNRLLRSLRKLQKNMASVNFSIDDWQSLKQGYAAVKAES